MTSDAGFTAEVTGDTLAVDLSAELGSTNTYMAVYHDVNETLQSLRLYTRARTWRRRHHVECRMEPHLHGPRGVARRGRRVGGTFAGNLQYVTGFDGVQFYDPNGLSFLNTLGSLTPGNGYW